jgi:predicted glutamine amidotransferase
MCIAIVKPKFADFPTTTQFRNCFTTNPHGAGFMYSNGENLIIKKGFMTFEDFINAFEQENISKDKLVFFHFRIATHGLIDGGNTHPFPLSMNVSEQRNECLKYKGYGLIHNGVFKYDKTEFLKYDPSGVISDTMLLAMKIKQHLDNKDKFIKDLESAIVFNLFDKDILTEKLINECIGYNKVAIMNEKEEYVKYGKWIEDNCVFYSNDDYSFDINDYNYYGYNYRGCFSDEFCAICGEILEWNKYQETTIGYCCNTCCNTYKLEKCKGCGLMFLPDKENNGFCEDCDFDYDLCEVCGTREATIITDDDKFICDDCYNKMLRCS